MNRFSRTDALKWSIAFGYDFGPQRRVARDNCINARLESGEINWAVKIKDEWNIVVARLCSVSFLELIDKPQTFLVKRQGYLEGRAFLDGQTRKLSPFIESEIRKNHIGIS